MTESRSDYTLKYFMYLLGKLKTCIILSLIFSFFGFPTAKFASASYRDPNLQMILAALALICIAGSIVISYAAPLIARGYMFARPSSDNILSLPLTAFQRYICEAGASLLVSIVPCALSLPLLLLLPLDRNYSGSVFDVAVVMLMTILMFVSCNLFLTNFCGRLAEALLYPAAFNIVIPLFVSLASWLSHANIFGMSYEIYAHNFSYSDMFPAALVSPAGSFIYHFAVYNSRWGILMIAPVYSAVMLLLGYPVYKKRPVENIGQPFVYKKAYAVNSLIIAVGCIVSYISVFVLFVRNITQELVIIAAAVLAVLVLILLLIMEFINYKKIHSIPKFFLKYIGTLAAGTLTAFGLYSSEGFGEAYYVPSEDDTLYIYGSVISNDQAFNNEYYLMFTAEGGSNDLSELLRSEHRRIAGEHIRESGKTELHLEYYLKNGTILYRRYEGNIPDDLTERIISAEEYKFSELNSFESKYGVTYDYGTGTILPTLVFNDKPEEKIGVRVTNLYTGEEYFRVREIDYTGLKAALAEDLGNDGDFGRHSDAPSFRLSIGVFYENDYNSNSDDNFAWNGGSAEYMIYESYVNTAEFLKKYGSVPAAEKAISDITGRDGLISLIRYPTDCTQTAVPASAYAMMDLQAAEAVFISADEFEEAASFSVCISKEQEYAYYICAGVPGLFDNDRVYGADESMLPQLEESGMLGDKFIYDETYGTVIYPKSPKLEVPVNEKHYPQLEKYFGDRYVFRRAD